MQGGISHQGVLLRGSSEIFPTTISSWRSSNSPTTLILQSKATSCPATCHPSQGEIAIEDWLWLSWTVLVFLGGGKMRKNEEK